MTTPADRILAAGVLRFHGLTVDGWVWDGVMRCGAGETVCNYTRPSDGATLSLALLDNGFVIGRYSHASETNA